MVTLTLEILEVRIQILEQQEEALHQQGLQEEVLIQQGLQEPLVLILIMVQKRILQELRVQQLDQVIQQSREARITALEREHRIPVQRALILAQKVIRVLIIADLVVVIIEVIVQQGPDQLAGLQVDQVAGREVVVVGLHLEEEDDE